MQISQDIQNKLGNAALSAMFGGSETQPCPYKLGAAYFIRTVTHHFTGRLTAVYPQELVVEDAAWIADSGRFADALKTGDWNEIEPYPNGPVILGRSSIIDAREITTPLPRSQK